MHPGFNPYQPESRPPGDTPLRLWIAGRTKRLRGILLRLPVFCFLLARFALPLFAAEIPGKSDAPIHLKADHLQYFKEKEIYVTQGAVVIEQERMRLEADAARLNGKTGKLTAMGNIHYFDGENTIDAERLTLDINTKLGVLYEGRLFMKESNYYIQGKEIIRDALDHYRLKTGAFTACDCQENPAWRIRAVNLDLTIDEYLFAKHARFYVKEVPVFYFPYFFYPANRERRTGLLTPNIGMSSRYGFRYNQRFFLALADNKDATISVDHRGKKGNGLGLQYRYVLSKKGRGEINVDFFKDKENNVDRWEVRMHHNQQFTTRVQGKLDIKYVNEASNLRQLSDRTVERAKQNIESNLSLTYQGDHTYAYFLARYTQDLTQNNNSATPQRLPEIGFSVIEYRLGQTPLYLNVDTTAVNFWSEGGLNLQRVDIYPKLSLPLRLSRHATLTPWAGFRETWYRHGDKSQGPQGEEAVSRKTLPLGVTLEGNGTLNWGKTTQRISSAIMYEKIDVSDGDNLIQIDELDALHDRENLTISLMQRFLKLNDKGQIEEKASLRFTETYHLNKIPKVSNTTRRFSDLRTEFHFRPWTTLALEVDTFYNLEEGRLNTINSDLSVTPVSYFNFKVGHRSSRAGAVPQKGDLFNPYYLGDLENIAPKVEFFSGEATVNTPWGIRYTNKIRFDLDAGEKVEVDHIVHYQAQCWGIGFSYIEFYDRDEFSFFITLKGLGSFSPQQ